MKVSDVRGPKEASSTRRKKSASGGGCDFASALKEAAGAASVESGFEAGAVASVDAILTLQEVPDAADGRSRGLIRQYGEDLLDRLDELRHDLLSGAIPKDRLAALAHTVRAHKTRTADPVLKAVIEEIELRVEVEIAKWTR